MFVQYLFVFILTTERLRRTALRHRGDEEEKTGKARSKRSTRLKLPKHGSTTENITALIGWWCGTAFIKEDILYWLSLEAMVTFSYKNYAHYQSARLLPPRYKTFVLKILL